MRKFRVSEERTQLSLLPPSIEDYVPDSDVVRYVDKVVDEFNLSAIEGEYSTEGRPGYSPKMLVKIIMYGKIRGIRSGRELAQACRENLRFIFLAQNEKPDFRTINDFRKHHSAHLAGLLRQTIEIGIRHKLIDLAQVCIDGTKLGASAGRRSFKKPETLTEELNKLEQELKGSFEADCEQEKQEDARYGDSDGEPRLGADIRNKKDLAERVRKALREHEESNKKDKPESISTTDPECRMMKGKGVNPSYNAQAAIDVKSRMAVGGYVVNACCDSSELIPVIDSVKELTGSEPALVSADRGYTRIEHLTNLEQRGIDGYISQRERRGQFTYDEGRDVYVCSQGRDLVRIENNKNDVRYAISECGGCAQKPSCWRAEAPRRTVCVSYHEASARRMRTKVQSEKGRDISRVRASTIEPLFGTIKFARRFRQVTVRGLKRVNELWQMELAAYNLARLYRQLGLTETVTEA